MEVPEGSLFMGAVRTSLMSPPEKDGVSKILFEQEPGPVEEVTSADPSPGVMMEPDGLEGVFSGEVASFNFRKNRDSARHSFVRKALQEHQDKANNQSSRLAQLRASAEPRIDTRGTWRRQLDVFVSSPVFVNFIMVLIMMNVVLLGVEVDLSATLGQSDVPGWFGMANTLIVCVFVVEVMLKILAQGCFEYWCGQEALWNIMDVIIITVSVVETSIDLWAQTVSSGAANSSHLRLVRSIRLARALRGVRVVRIFRYVSALRTLALCIVSTVGSLLWTLVLLVLLFYTFGVPWKMRGGRR
ncbi:unnamed protein product [Effrenium voratum]|uniref:Ion transport domain-containing protein n=1 Tax=Effrenium voratum TaxID=2562239 RepID=A0AA36MTQ3_9DINO|nr:unnamed protein product [Effrenium voratum]